MTCCDYLIMIQANTLPDSHSLHVTVSTYQKNTWGTLLEKVAFTVLLYDKIFQKKKKTRSSSKELYHLVLPKTSHSDLSERFLLQSLPQTVKCFILLSQLLPAALQVATAEDVDFRRGLHPKCLDFMGIVNSEKVSNNCFSVLVEVLVVVG